MPAISYPIGVEHGLPYVITGPDGTRAVINDSTDPDYVGYLNPATGGGVTGLERAGVRENSDLLPEADGGVHGTFLRDRLSFTLGGIIPPDSPGTANDGWVGRQARLLRATDALDADAVLTWTPTNAVPVRLAFRAQQAARITGTRPKNFLVSGVAEGSGIEAQTPQVVAIPASGSGSGGFASPLTSLLTSTAGVSGTGTCTAIGAIDAWPTLTITGPCSNPTVVNSTIGAGLYFAYTLAAGQTLVVDTDPRRRTVKLDGVTNRFDAVSWALSRWWALQPGANVVQIGFSSYSAPAGVTISWKDAWG